MTVEEKQDLLIDFCSDHTGCGTCPLNDASFVWQHPCHTVNCLNIGDSPEEDLDKALKILGKAKEEMVEEPDFFNKKFNLPDDPVNHPSHYTDGKIEVIDFITDKKLGFCLGNAVKYIARAGKKDPSKTIEDLEKAIWYIKHHIETIKEG